MFVLEKEDLLSTESSQSDSLQKSLEKQKLDFTSEKENLNDKVGLF